MPIEVIMPKFDMDQEKATVIEWVKKEGDQVEYGEGLLTVETDKVAIEVPSPASGRLVRISAKPKEVVPVAKVIAYILGKGESIDDLPAEVKEVEGGESSDRAFHKGTITAPAREEPEISKGARTKASPVAARMAKSMGIDMQQVMTSGERITKADVRKYVQQAYVKESPGKKPATPAARHLSKEMGIDLNVVAGSGPSGRVQASDVMEYAHSLEIKTIQPAAGGQKREAELIPLEGIRRTIAERMQASFHDIPHIALIIEVDVSNLEELRSRLNEAANHEYKNNISITALLVRLTAETLRRHPYLNSSLLDETIRLWKDINIGVATAIPGGLIVPVIRNADQKPLNKINEELIDLVERARKNRLSLDEVKGGTFTISNLGMYGVTQFRAIINPPESAILAVGKVVRKLVVTDERDSLAIRPMMCLTLSADHRVVDGVRAAEFLRDLGMAIESPAVMLKQVREG